VAFILNTVDNFLIVMRYNSSAEISSWSQ